MSEEKRIIIDEDWKSQVEAEKEALQHQAESAPGGNPDASQGTVADPPMPTASFDLLLSTLATEAMIALGMVPHPATGKNEFRPNQAKYLIDTIAMLGEKTQGNLTAGESQATAGLLHQLRMVYVEVANAARAASQPQSAESGQQLPAHAPEQ